jgi:hypothetical protein
MRLCPSSYFRIARGTKTQYPTTSSTGAMVVPPRMRSANPRIKEAAASPHQRKDRARELVTGEGMGA